MTVKDLADRTVLEHLTQPFEDHLLHELDPDPPCTRLADMQRIAILLKLLEWPGYRAIEGGPPYLTTEGHPNTRYMKIQTDKSQPNKSPLDNEYRNRLVLPDPTQFDESYFRGKSRPQVLRADQLRVNQVDRPAVPQQRSMSEAPPQVANVRQAPAEENTSQPGLSLEVAALAKEFPVDREVRNLTPYAESKQGVEVAIWNRDPRKVIGFIPRELIDRQLGRQISGIVTGLRQEPGGRIVVELKLRPKR